MTCHNPGSWVAGTPNATVDFKVMVHRIHYNNAGAALPSVQAGVPLHDRHDRLLGGDFPAGRAQLHALPRRHAASRGRRRAVERHATPQGDHWKTQPSLQACGSCHDNVYFGSAPDPTKPYQNQAALRAA